MIETIAIIAIGAIILGTVYYNINRKDSAPAALSKPATVSATAKPAKKTAARKPAPKKTTKKVSNKKA